MPGNQPHPGSTSCRLRLFMAGEEHNSVMARENLHRIESEHLAGQDVSIEIIDVLQDYRTALEHNILVTPALLVSGPRGEVVILGNLRNTEKVLVALRRAGVRSVLLEETR